MNDTTLAAATDETAIAIIGMACHLPGARNLDEYWQNLCNGVESIAFFTPDELIEHGCDPALAHNPNYIGAHAILPDIEMFDAAYFGYTPREAELLDPQQRIFLECAVEALEHAGYAPERYPGAIGVYAGCNTPLYMINNLFFNPTVADAVDGFQMVIGNDKDFLPTRVSYKLNLKGPGVNVQTACSTSLVAVHLASQALATGECSMALAGGVAVHVPQVTGSLYSEGMIHSTDGHCRAFDAKAQGTVGGNGVGLVVLKRLEEALTDGDTIYAVIRSSAINNDGALKVGYTAPSVEGQSAVIADALALAGINPETIGYIEAHGTATNLGDPIEVRALTQAFRAYTGKTGFCAIGSVKSNIGHTRAAAGVAGLIKTVLAVQHGQIPASLFYETPNPQIDFANSPFFVNSHLRTWPQLDQPGVTPRRAGVSSFGVGGTNAHVIVEEAPRPVAEPPAAVSRPAHLLLLSAKSPTALSTATDNLARHLAENPALNLADVAYTLQVGRQLHPYRQAIVCTDQADALAILKNEKAPQRFTGYEEAKQRRVTFLFSGGGAQYVNMARDLYQHEPFFRAIVDDCAERLQRLIHVDMRTYLYPQAESAESVEQMRSAFIGLPALFVVEYALAKLWMAWGITPTALLGHSLGEYTAACLAGVFSLDDALQLVALRGRLFQTLPRGAMLGVPLSEAALQPFLHDQLAIAAINTPTKCVVSGPEEAITALEAQLSAARVDSQRINIAGAAHSPVVTPILAAFQDFVSRLTLRAPQIPFVSNLTGQWIRTDEATDPTYWANHLRHTVRFAQGVATLLAEHPEQTLLEVGPGRTLATFAQQHPAKARQTMLASLRNPQERQSDVGFLLATLGKLWLDGAPIDWDAFQAGARRQRIALPTYPFERKRCWVEAPTLPRLPNGAAAQSTVVKQPLDAWFYAPQWRQTPSSARFGESNLPTGAIWLLFLDRCGLGAALAEQLTQAGQRVFTVTSGAAFAQVGASAYTIHPEQAADYQALLHALGQQDAAPTAIVHLWSVTPLTEMGPTWLDTAQTHGFYSLLYLAQALADDSAKASTAIALTIVSNNMQEVVAEELLAPEKATLLGAVKVLPQEHADITCCSVDVLLPPYTDATATASDPQLARLATQLLNEVSKHQPNAVVAYRGKQRWQQQFERVALGEVVATPRLRAGGVYLITGGLGGVGLAIAEDLAHRVQAKLVLLGRSLFPERATWAEWQATHAADEPTSQKIRKILALEALGAEVLVLSADVADATQMTAVVEQIRSRFGQLNGIVHSAGVIPTGDTITMLRKTRSAAERVFAPKVQGTLLLDTLFQHEPLDFVLYCSSLAAVVGGMGQADYAGANAFLDAFAYYAMARTTDQRRVFTTSINWGSWQEVGRAVEVVARFSGQPVSRPDFHPFQHPLFEQAANGSRHEAIYVTHLSVDRHWLVREHRVAGKAMLPGTAYLEMVRAAFTAHTGQSTAEIQNLYLLTPLIVQEHEIREVRTSLTGVGAPHAFINAPQRYTFAIVSRGRGEEAWVEHAQGEIGELPLDDQPGVYDLNALADGCQAGGVDLTVPGYQRPTSFVEVSDRWRNLRWIKLGADVGLGFLAMPEAFISEREAYPLHPALLDEATSFLLGYKISRPHMPFSYKGVRMRGALPAQLYSYMEHLTAANDAAGLDQTRFRIALLDETGKALMEITEYSHRPVNLQTLETPRVTKATPGAKAEPAARGFQDHLEAGMKPLEGAEAFERVLQGTLPQVLVSTIDLQAHTAYRQAALHRAESKPQTTFHARPALHTSYSAPRNETEQSLATIWQNLLGIESVGIDDNYFALGGNSLSATQVLARIREAFQVQLPIATLFEEPTIAQLAAWITAKQLEKAEAAALHELLAEVGALSDAEVALQLSDLAL